MTMTMTKPPALCVRAFEFRAEPSDDGRTLEGYAAVFGDATRIDSWEGQFDEVIRHGAFAKTIKDRTPVMQFNHGRDVRTGAVPIAAIQELREDKTGLFVRAGLFDNETVEPIRQAIAGGAIDGMSFRFRVVRERWTDTKGKEVPASELTSLLWNPGDRGPLQRELVEVEVPELGPVVFPAYKGTTVGVRSLLTNLDEDERRQLIHELAAEITDLNDPAGAGRTATPAGAASDAGQQATSEQDPDAGQQATSGLSLAEREHALRELDLRTRRAS